MNKLIISLDYDDVLFPFVETLLIELNKKHNLDIKLNDLKTWKLVESIPLTEEQIFSPIFNDKFWKTMKPYDEAIWFVNQLLADGHEVQVVTASFFQCVKPKIERLIECFPLTYADVIISSKKQRIITDYLVDDAIHNLIGGSYKGILKDMPHNRDYNEKEDNQRIRRVKDLYKAYEIIKYDYKFN